MIKLLAHILRIFTPVKFLFTAILVVSLITLFGKIGITISIIIVTLGVAADAYLASSESRQKREWGAEQAAIRSRHAREATVRQDIETARASRLPVNLQGRDLAGFDLSREELCKANLQGANLQGANLQGANLQEAKLQGANLQEANLQEANLMSTKLEKASLYMANLQGVNLQGADLSFADLEEANLYDTLILGDLIGTRIWGVRCNNPHFEKWTSMAYKMPLHHALPSFGGGFGAARDSDDLMARKEAYDSWVEERIKYRNRTGI